MPLGLVVHIADPASVANVIVIRCRRAASPPASKFKRETLEREPLGDLDLHRTVDTTGYADAKLLLDVAQKTDLFLYDLKFMDPVKHHKYTGVSNAKIMRNLKLLAQNDARVQVRIPILPGMNTDAANIEFTGGIRAADSIGDRLLIDARGSNTNGESYFSAGDSFRLAQRRKHKTSRNWANPNSADRVDPPVWA